MNLPRLDPKSRSQSRSNTLPLRPSRISYRNDILYREQRTRLVRSALEQKPTRFVELSAKKPKNPEADEGKQIKKLLKLAKGRVLEKIRVEPSRTRSVQQLKLLDEWQFKVFKKKWGASLGPALFEQEKMSRLKAELKKKGLPDLGLITQLKLPKSSYSSHTLRVVS